MLKRTQVTSNNEVNPDNMFRFLPEGWQLGPIISGARRQLWLVLTTVILTTCLGALFLFFATPQFTSTASVLIDAKNVGISATTPLEGSLTLQASSVQSQLQILVSDRLARAVAVNLGLQNNPLFIDPPPSLLASLVTRVTGKIKRLLGISAGGGTNSMPVMSLPEEARILIAIANLQSNLVVTLVPRTYVFIVAYTDRDPSLAQVVTAQFANSYIEDQLDSKLDTTKRAANWMDERIRDLKSRSLAADTAVQNYRASNNLVAASGRLIDDQVLTDATTQLTTARGAFDAAKARYQRLRDIVETQDVTASLAEALESPNVAQLRAKYLLAAKLQSDIASRYGVDHLSAQRARGDMEEYKRLIFEELKNLLPGYESDVAIAQSKIDSITATINQLRGVSAANESAMVKLRSLEQEADSLKTLYSTFLQKSQEMQQQQTFPVTEARVIDDASLSLTPSSPKRLLVGAASIFLGLVIGSMLALWREWRDRGLRTAAQIRDELGLEFVANVPELPKPKRRKSITAHPEELVEVQHSNLAGRSTVRSKLPTLRAVLDEPYSQFSEAIRSLKYRTFSELQANEGTIIGIVSLFSDEGKSTVAKSLGSSLAMQNVRTLLIDGDLRNPSLTESLVPARQPGIVDFIGGKVTFSQIVYSELESGLAFIPSGTKRQFSNDFFGSSKSRELLNLARKEFEIIVIDFPPLAALTDAVAANPDVDGYFLITHWGKTPRKAIKDFLSHRPKLADKILGVVLNRVDLKRLRHYDPYFSPVDYGRYAERYFSTSTSSE